MLDTYSRKEEGFLVFFAVSDKKVQSIAIVKIKHRYIHIFTYTQSERRRTSKLRTTIVGFVSYLRIAIFQHLQLCNFYDKLA